MRRGLLSLALLSCAAGCAGDAGTSLDHACRRDSDCPRAEMKCVAGAGVCVGFSTSLEAADAGPGDAR